MTGLDDTVRVAVIEPLTLCSAVEVRVAVIDRVVVLLALLVRVRVLVAVTELVADGELDLRPLAELEEVLVPLRVPVEVRVSLAVAVAERVPDPLRELVAVDDEL